MLAAENARLRAENSALREEFVQARTDAATREMKIDELRRTVERQQRVLRGLVEALADDDIDVNRLLASLEPTDG